MTRQVVVREVAGEPRIQAVPFAHLSIELGHLYFEDFSAGPAHLRAEFARLAPWAEAARRIRGTAAGGPKPRISTCFLVDDYFAPTSSPAAVLPTLLQAARDSGLEIDYLAREAACAEADGVPVARLVEERIVADPPPETNGLRPPVTETGWLCNGQRSPAAPDAEAMGGAPAWRPPVENAAYRHSIFVDVELWHERRGGRTWSCAFLAAVWQLLRLGLLRFHGRPVAAPAPWPDELPETWDELPPVVRLNPTAAPFYAYQNLSILPGRFFATEHAVRTILQQVAVDDGIAAQVHARSEAEGLSLPLAPIDRVDYVFVN